LSEAFTKAVDIIAILFPEPFQIPPEDPLQSFQMLGGNCARLISDRSSRQKNAPAGGQQGL